jgi:anti-anti-sigma factor
MDPGTDGVRGLSVSSRTGRGHVIAVLSGELDIASAPALREQLLGLLRPAASRLVIDLSAVSYADASGLAVLAGTGRRAGLLGGFLRLAAPAPAVARVLRLTGLHLRLDIFPTVQAAITSPARGQRRPDGRPDAGTDIGAGTVHTGPARGHTGRSWHAADAAELRQATAAVLIHADAWRDADPGRRFTPALDALAPRPRRHQPGRPDPGRAFSAVHPHPAAPHLLPGCRRDRQPSSPPPRPDRRPAPT